MLNDVEQNPIEPAPLPVIKITVDLRARQLYCDRPDGICVKEKGLASAISQKSSARMHAKWEAYSPDGVDGRRGIRRRYRGGFVM